MSIKSAITTAAVLAVLAAPALAGDYGRASQKAYGYNAPKMMDVYSGTRASYGRSDFAGWPTDYLVNRFGDFQMQGR
jgi:hypothetical protein